MISSYRDLIVWQKAIELVTEIYKLTDLFPKNEIYGLTNQARRAAVSIPANIAEGCARGYRKEYRQFILIAYASGAELETHLLIAKNLKFANFSEIERIEKLLDEVMRMTNKLSQALATK